MTYKEIYQRLKDKFGDSLTVVEEEGGKPVSGDPYVLVKKEKIKEVSSFLRDESDLAFDMPTCVSGLDDGKNMWVVYHLYSTKRNHSAILKVEVGRENPSVPSMMSIWRGVDWHERETYDMYGIRFEGHGDLRRILMPENWPGYPLRKDYEYPDEWEGIPLK